MNRPPFFIDTLTLDGLKSQRDWFPIGDELKVRVEGHIARIYCRVCGDAICNITMEVIEKMETREECRKIHRWVQERHRTHDSVEHSASAQRP